MPFPAALKVLGPALTATAEGLQAVPELIDKDEELQQRRALRPLTLEEARLRLQKTREGIHPTHFTAHGIYEWNPAEGRYTYTQSEEQKKYSAKEAEMGAIVLYGGYPEGSPQKKLYDAYVSRMGAPGVIADTRARMVEPTIQKMKDQAAHWKQLEDQALRNGDARAQHYGDLARHYGDLATHYEHQSADTRYGIDTRSDTSRYGIDTRDAAVDRQIDDRQLRQQTQLKQGLQVHRERLKAHEVEVDKRLAAAQAAGDQRGVQQAARDKAALERQRERLDWEADKLEMQEYGKGSRLDTQEEGRSSRQQLTEEERARRLNQTEDFRAPGEQARTDLSRSRLRHGISKEERDEEAHQLKQRTGEEKLSNLQTKGKYLDERQKAELIRIQEQAATLKARGETMGPYLQARLDKLQESAEQARNRELRLAEKAPVDLGVKQEQLAKLKAQRVSPARQLTIRKLEAEIAELQSRAQERGAGEVAVQTIGPQGEQTTSRYRGKDADLYRFMQGRMTGDASRDAAMVLAIPQAHARLIAREAYQQRYGKRLPAEADSSTPALESSGAAAQTAPGQLSVAETLEQINKIGLPDPDGPGDRAVQEFLTRFKTITAAQALSGYKRLKDPEMKKAFKIAYLDFYKQRPPD